MPGVKLDILGNSATAQQAIQGVVGGLRVILTTDALAMVHGPVAQAFFALIVALALATSARMAVPSATLPISNAFGR